MFRGNFEKRCSLFLLKKEEKGGDRDSLKQNVFLGVVFGVYS